MPAPATVVALKLSGRTAAGVAAPQTLLCTPVPDMIAPLWLGLRGPNQTLTLILGRERGRSPHYWIGPDLGADSDFGLDVALYPDMGPGGVLWRHSGEARWTSCTAISATGLERFSWPADWRVGHGEGGPDHKRYAGPRLDVAAAVIALS
ncbi:MULTISPECIES: hypothetical protein [unclassified Bradyrhizobium]